MATSFQYRKYPAEPYLKVQPVPYPDKNQQQHVSRPLLSSEELQHNFLLPPKELSQLPDARRGILACGEKEIVEDGIAVDNLAH
jgi:hypothetical protein